MRRKAIQRSSVICEILRQKTILDILETPIIDIVNVFKESKKVCQTLSSMIELGLGYLKLGQMSMNLSGGEAQRVKLAKALSSSSYGQKFVYS